MFSEACCSHKEKPFYTNKLFIISVLSFFSVIICSFFSVTESVFAYFLQILSLVWWAMVLGFLVGGLIDHYIPQRYVEKMLAQPKKRTLITAVLLGTLLSTCCHGILAIAMMLYKKGASLPAMLTLLMAAPWANFPMTILMVVFGMKGWLIIGCAIIVALIVGFIFQQLHKANLLDPSIPGATQKEFDFSIRSDIKNRFRSYHFLYHN